MNCPSRADPGTPEGWNQNPDALNKDATTRADMEFIASARLKLNSAGAGADGAGDDDDVVEKSRESFGDRHIEDAVLGQKGKKGGEVGLTVMEGDGQAGGGGDGGAARGGSSGGGGNGKKKSWREGVGEFYQRAQEVFLKYVRFIGPGFMVAVAYIDPGMYSVHTHICTKDVTTSLQIFSLFVG